MANTQRDGVAGYVSDYIETDRVIEDRPDDAPFVRLTHFPYDEFYTDHAAIESGEWNSAEGEGVPRIPLGQAYETTIWDGREDIRDAYFAVKGPETACQQALDVATDHDIPIWDTILRLRPRTIIIEDTPMHTVSGDYTAAVMETDDGNWVAIDRESGVGAWETSKDAVLTALDERRVWYEETETRPGEIVQTEDVLGGTPRVAGSRIGVTHILDMYEHTGSIPETAASFVGPLTLDEVNTALAWADGNPEKLETVRERRADVRAEFGPRGQPHADRGDESNSPSK